MHPDYADPVRRAALHRLFDAVWPGIDARLAIAAGFGWDWDAITTPFARYAGDVAVAHVGVLDLPAWVNGERTRVAGVHAVCTHPEHRGRGHFRAVMEEALAFADSFTPLAKLSTGQPHLYERFGFSVVEQHAFALDRSHPGHGAARALTASDLRWLHQRLAERRPTCDAFTALDEGWLLGICEVLSTGGLTHLHAVGDVVVAWELREGVLHVFDVIASAPFDAEALLAGCPWPYAGVRFWFDPAAFVAGARPVPWPEDDVLMVRGPWELPRPFGMSPLATH